MEQIVRKVALCHQSRSGKGKNLIKVKLDKLTVKNALMQDSSINVSQKLNILKGFEAL